MPGGRQAKRILAATGRIHHQSTEVLAVRARVPLDVLRDTIQRFPTFSEIYVAALKALRREIAPVDVTRS